MTEGDARLNEAIENREARLAVDFHWYKDAGKQDSWGRDGRQTPVELKLSENIYKISNGSGDLVEMYIRH